MDNNRLGTYTEFIQKALDCTGQRELDSLLESCRHIIDAELLEFVKESANWSLLDENQTYTNDLLALVLHIDKFMSNRSASNSEVTEVMDNHDKEPDNSECSEGINKLSSLKQNNSDYDEDDKSTIVSANVVDSDLHLNSGHKQSNPNTGLTSYIVLQPTQTNTRNKWHKFILFLGTLTGVASVGIIGGEIFRHGYAVHHNNNGSAKYENQMYAEAIREYDQAIAWSPRFAISYLNRGNAKLKLGQYSDAIKDYGLAIQIDSKLADAYYNRGNARLQLGDFQEAITDYKTALQINPNHKGASNALRNTEQRVSYGRTPEIQESSPQKSVPEDNYDYYITSGNTKYESNDFYGAINDYSRAIAIKPTEGIAYYNRGIATLEIGKEKLALSDFESALPLLQRESKTELYRQAQSQISRLKAKLQPNIVYTRFPFPMDACGDPPDSSIEAWHPVYTDFSQQLLSHIRTNYCRDAIPTVVDGKKLIQVASFVDRDKAQEFAGILRTKVGSGKVGNPTLVSSTDSQFPMDACGDPPVSRKDKWYPVYLAYSEPLFADIKYSYCRDAVVVSVNGKQLIQVASFRNLDSAQQFADMLREKFGSGMVGEPYYFPIPKKLGLHLIDNLS